MNNRHRLCAFPNCTSHATFKHVGAQQPTYCGAHREEGMVQVSFLLSATLELQLYFYIELGQTERGSLQQLLGACKRCRQGSYIAPRGTIEEGSLWLST